jgi:hypothetical protein
MGGVDTAFPSTDRDRLLCGLLCDLVAARPGLPSDAYLDALIIVLCHQRHKKLLVGGDRTQFTALAEKLRAKGEAGVSIPWADLLDLLTQREAIRQNSGTALDRAARYDEVRGSFPACDPKLVQLVHTAAANLRDFQSPGKATSTDGQEVLSSFNEDKRSLCGGPS